MSIAHTAYHNAAMQERDPSTGLVAIIEAPYDIDRILPKFALDLSGAACVYPKSPKQTIHGTYLVQYQDAMLFGPNNLVTLDGRWSCETRHNKGYIIPYMHASFYDRNFPGKKPVIEFDGLPSRLDVSNLASVDVEIIDGPVFLATPLEPSIWGRWISTVLPKVTHYLKYGRDRKFFCYAAAPWQREFLKVAGLPDESLLPHDPGRTYICRDVMTVEFSDLSLDFSEAERAHLNAIARENRDVQKGAPKLFISRLSRSRAMPTYRVLQNESALAEALEAAGFATIEPEALSIREQIAIFAQARVVVGLGGSGLFNAAFCAPDTRIVTIESSERYIGVHAAMLSSLRLRYGIIFGREDPADPNVYHKRWSLDIAPAMSAIKTFVE